MTLESKINELITRLEAILPINEDGANNDELNDIFDDIILPMPDTVIKIEDKILELLTPEELSSYRLSIKPLLRGNTMDNREARILCRSLKKLQSRL